MSIGSSFPERLRSRSSNAVVEFVANGFPLATHPAEVDIFSRQAAMPGHDQAAFDTAHVLIVGCGGLGGWMALALSRMGIRQLSLCDPDVFDRSNAPRQLMFPGDLGQSKAHVVAGHVATHMISA